MQPIFLIGYMGSGKTTLGRALGKALSRDFIDLDKYIENRFMRTIRQLFDERGEEQFREIERSMLHEVAEMENVIVACGGGTPCFFDNVDYMNSRGATVFLEASLERLFERLSRNRRKRPLIKDMTDEQLRAFIVSNLDDRRRYYSRAKHSFCGDELEDMKQIRQTVDKFITQYNTVIYNN